jgi:hypothetical protein
MALFTAFVLVLLAGSAAGWAPGRATRYDTIDNGSCGFGYISPDSITGRDIAALPSAVGDYANSCG